MPAIHLGISGSVPGSGRLRQLVSCRPRRPLLIRLSNSRLTSRRPGRPSVRCRAGRRDGGHHSGHHGLDGL